MGMMPVFYNSNYTKPVTRRKFRSADEKRAWELAQTSEYGMAAKRTTKKVFDLSVTSVPKLTAPPGRETPRYPSRVTSGWSTARPADKFYTGTMIKGIGTMHKSNAVPIFSNEEAVDIANMRRG